MDTMGRAGPAGKRWDRGPGRDGGRHLPVRRRRGRDARRAARRRVRRQADARRRGPLVRRLRIVHAVRQVAGRGLPGADQRASCSRRSVPRPEPLALRGARHLVRRSVSYAALMAPQLWMLRHGEAVPHDSKPDPERELTPRGRTQSEAAGRALAALSEEFDACYASPKVRAWETAVLACASL